MAVLGVKADLVPQAPYADTPIRLSMLSISTERYKTYYCFECRHPFLQRDNDTLYRINSNDEPARAYADEAGILISCGKCKQKYVGTVVVAPPRQITHNYPQIPTVQSIYLSPSDNKKQRYMGCMECGKVFCSITDRIALIVDNVAPVEALSHERIGLLEVMCKQPKCGQLWALIV